MLRLSVDHRLFATIRRREGAMLSEGWRALVRKYLVYDVPDEMAACFDCDAVQCPNEKYETCPNRLAHATALKAARAAD
jgi:hypothetical protein